MRSPSPKARLLIEAALRQLQNRELEDQWVRWSRQNPFRRSRGFINEERVELPPDLARAIVAGISVIINILTDALENRVLSPENAIIFENDLGFAEQVKADVSTDIYARV